MNIFRYNERIAFPLKKLSVAMGNFDGLHLGHRSIIDLAKPKNSSAKYGVLTFEPHPRQFFFPHQKPFRLMTERSKQMKLKNLGLDVLLEVPFNQTVSIMEPNVFVETILCNYFDLGHIVVGEDFRFGFERKGTADLLKSIAEPLGINVTIATLIKDMSLEISSTAIREALENGAPEKAARMLGDQYSIIGTVRDGEKRGRTLGYPTINLELLNLHLPRFGVYSALVKILTGNYQGSYAAVVSIGERPTYGKKEPNLEAHLFDFSENIYGEEVCVSLISFQRPEIGYSSSTELIKQMEKDCVIAQECIQKSGLL